MSGLSDSIDFKLLEARLVGSDTVVYRLEDGTLVKVRVDIDRAGIAVNFRNPDGSPHYNITVSNKISVIPPEKTFKVPRDQLNVSKEPSKDKEPYR